jgi:hypothetical protein
MALSSEPSRKRGREEVPPPPPAEVKPPPPDEPEEALQPVAVVRAPPLNAYEATWSVNLFRDASVKLRKVAMKDYAFKLNVLVGDLERGVLAPVDDDGNDDGSLDGSGSDSDGGAPPAATTSA